MRKYADFHREARLKAKNGEGGEARAKYITFTCKEDTLECVGGLGDTLVGLATAFLVALVTNRVFLIDWDTKLNHVFEPAGIDWRMTPGLGLGQDGRPGQEEWSIQEVNFINSMHAGFRDHSIPHVAEALGAVDHIVMKGNRGIVTMSVMGEEDKELSDKLINELGLRPPTAFGCILRLLLR